MNMPEFSENKESDAPDKLVPSEIVLLENDDDVIKLLANTLDTLNVHDLDVRQTRARLERLLEKGMIRYAFSQPDNQVNLLCELEDGTVMVWSYQLDPARRGFWKPGDLIPTKTLLPHKYCIAGAGPCLVVWVQIQSATLAF